MKKRVTDLKLNDIIVYVDEWGSGDASLLKINDMERGAVSYRVECLTLNDSGNKWSNRITFVRLWEDETVDVFSSLKTAKKAIKNMHTDEILPFFVYGTLRHGFGNYSRLLAGKTTAEAPAIVAGSLWHTGSIVPYMKKTVVEDTVGIVHGEVMWVPEEIYYSTLRALDALEGYRKGARWNHYNREKVVATLEDGSKIEVWAYYHAESEYSYARDYMINIPHGDYRKWVLEEYAAIDRFSSKKRR